MLHYKKRPLAVEAFVYRGNDVSDWPKWASDCITKGHYQALGRVTDKGKPAIRLIRHKNKQYLLLYVTSKDSIGPSAPVFANQGDYVVREPDGSIFLYEKNRFKEAHEVAPSKARIRQRGKPSRIIELFGDPV